MPSAEALARQFLEEETAFRLGALPTEQSHRKTRALSDTIADDTTAGIAQLLSVDAEIAPVAERIMTSSAWWRMVEAFLGALSRKRRITFTGCGATGRLSILLETAWRRFCTRVGRFQAQEDSLRSVMAGGDYALVKSVEGFEDFSDFGRYQLRRSGVEKGDVVVAITEGGETSFVIGTAWEALEAGAQVFFVYNNPTETLARHVERSRQVLEHPGIEKICLYTGPMAVAGSTRMQATTIELLVVGAALETALATMGAAVPRADAVQRFQAILAALRSPEGLLALAKATDLEERAYRSEGLVTYHTDDLLLDIFTDTTERSPTFALPPFRKTGDDAAPEPWAFVKHTRLGTECAWDDTLARPPRCLEWTEQTYRDLRAPAELVENPPALGLAELMRFPIGNEPAPRRCASGNDVAVAVSCGDPGAPTSGSPTEIPADFARRAAWHIGPGAPPPGDAESIRIAAPLHDSPLRLDARLALKLAFNTVSTATMARLGRVAGNWMVWVQPSNKKLIDRATRLLADRLSLSYDDACLRLFEAIETHAALPPDRRAALSPVALAIEEDAS